jgi:tryptophan synthase beta subunit
MNTPVDFSTFPDARGHFGIHGGRFVSETLMAALTDLEAMYMRLKDDPAFLAEFDRDLAHYVGRPSPLYHAERWSRDSGGRADLSEARRPEPHGRTQGEQHHRSGAAGQAFWARPASLPKPVPASMASPRRPLPHAWEWSAWCTWA